MRPSPNCGVVDSSEFRRIWSRLITGDGMRRTRFHTYSGNLIDWRGLSDLPRSIWSVLLLKALRYRQPVPWLGYRAVRRLSQILRPDSLVLEFGSGMSSLFFAARCRQLVSVESDAGWFHRLEKMLATRRIINVDYRLVARAEDYDLDDIQDHSMDLVIVDGLYRDRASVTAVRKVKPGGFIFLDNSDVPYPDHREARQVLSRAADQAGVELFNDLYPFQIQVNESMLVRTKTAPVESERAPM